MKGLAIVSVIFCAAVAHADPLGVGQTLFPAPAQPDPVGATLVAGGVPLGFASLNFSGTLTSSVLNNDASNPFGPNALTFTFLLANDGTSTDPLERLTINGYTGFATDASYQIPAAGIAPTLIDRLSADVTGFGFASFGPGRILPGQASALLVLQTNATQYVNSFASVQDGTNASVATYSPAPEPASLALMLVGLLAISRRRGK